MKWQNMRQSSNVEDARNSSSSGGFPGGMMGSGGGGGGLISLILSMLLSGRGGKGLILLLLVVMFLGGGLSSLGGMFDQGGSSVPPTEQSSGSNQDGQTKSQDDIVQEQGGDKATDPEMAFLSAVLASTEDMWAAKFKEHGMEYRNPTLHVYSGQVNTSGCGFSTAAAGPFYCPADEKVYIDLSFYRELKEKYKAPGDFAMAYVLAHEVGHHVQKLVGTMDQYVKLKSQLNEKEGNQLNVRLEVQADYYAGAWAKYAEQQGVLEDGDVEEAIQAAIAVGDDTLQKAAYGTVVPDSFTHGSAKQRTSWFNRGYQYGDFEHGDSFNSEIDLPQ
ncbi:neutral zinc metallopeptidase [Vaginisenegalia massiliensis]|uniref:KPN_02809 family neutral zinc metallopeptidase n=1 Tax=Vaginisenegalia massiliensis TaxID=2058294 RepID=UPI000F51F323|nr:neutral zinc metallopeptidase [Vaginisenegalia massiliensis]